VVQAPSPLVKLIYSVIYDKVLFQATTRHVGATVDITTAGEKIDEQTCEFKYFLPVRMRLDVTLGQLDECMQRLAQALVTSGLRPVAKPIFSSRDDCAWVSVRVWHTDVTIPLRWYEADDTVEGRVKNAVVTTLVPDISLLTVTT